MNKRSAPFSKAPQNSPLPGAVAHPDPANAHTVHGQPKGSGEVPKANNYADGTQNANDSPAGTKGFIS